MSRSREYIHFQHGLTTYPLKNGVIATELLALLDSMYPKPATWMSYIATWLPWRQQQTDLDLSLFYKYLDIDWNDPIINQKASLLLYRVLNTGKVISSRIDNQRLTVIFGTAQDGRSYMTEDGTVPEGLAEICCVTSSSRNPYCVSGKKLVPLL
jgi:hypothetical protein